MTNYGYKTDTTHQAIIFEVGSAADTDARHNPETPGLIVGSSEWGWCTEENGRRICAALKYFSGIPTEEIEHMATVHSTNRSVKLE
jgi:hypothetical protein